MDPGVVLQPLAEAEDDIRRLGAYEGAAELSRAILAVAEAADRSVRLRLRADPTAPDEHRLAALSPTELDTSEAVRSLRSRELISLEAAGTLHQLEAATARARSGEATPGDADVARRAVDLLRRDFTSADPALASPADTPLATAGMEQGVATGGAGGARSVPAPMKGRGGLMQAGALLVLVAAAVAAWLSLADGSSDRDRARAAFRAGRLDSAAAGFERVLERNSEDVSAWLYLGRIRRRQGQLESAAESLKRARTLAPEDAGVRRELGHLFMDLGATGSAIPQYERAVELAPDDPLSWAALIRALRAAGDPRAEELLRDASPEVRAALGR